MQFDLSVDIEWDGKTITQPGVYSGIPLEEYHNKVDLLDGPSVSKTHLQNMAPPDGNPKKFYHYWPFNPNHVKKPSSKEMNFGRAVHALLLGDEVFRDKYALRPDKAPDDREWHHANKSCKKWLAEQAEAGRTVLDKGQLEQIQRMADDAANSEIIKAGILRGRVERSMFVKDPKTKIWLKVRPDVIPSDSGMYADLKTSSSLNQDFLQRQLGDCGYYLQPALIRRACNLLNMTFESFTLIYSLSKEYGDTDYRDVSHFEVDTGERVIDYCLHKIRHGLDTGEWEGARTYIREERPLHMNSWLREQIDMELKRHDQEMLGDDTAPELEEGDPGWTP